MPTAMKSRQEGVPKIMGGSLYRECEVVQLPTQRGMLLMSEEGIGRAVWESYEKGVEAWKQTEEEAVVKAAAEEEYEAGDAPATSPPSNGSDGKMKES